jgi:predicted GNAT superfamily acetyltransferase
VTTSGTEALPAEALAKGLQIRHVRTHEEFLACVDLQMATWGEGFREAVPASMLKITQRLGGVTAGAFAEDGTLLGFIYGITGIERGKIVHWSDLLAVDARMQNHGLGRKLKEFQREAAREAGATRMYWTYDPLVARNAHFNLNRLGAHVDEYVPNMYGTNTGSTLHSGVGTDRFVVVWPLVAAEERRTSPAPRVLDAPIINDGAAHGVGVDLARFAASPPPSARIEVPSDIFRVLEESMARAAHWRTTTREAFQWALANGYSVDGFQRDGEADRGFYLLNRTSSAAPAVP